MTDDHSIRLDGLPEDTDYGPLTRQQAENIADFAAERARERMYAEIGRGVVKKAIYFLGAAGTCIAVWLSGYFHFGPK